MNKLILSLMAALVLAAPAKVLADQYGEVEVEKEISIEKKVQNPNTGDYVDNLFASDYLFKPTQEVIFRVTVKNTGDQDLTGIRYEDILPSYLSYVSGSLSDTFDLNVGQEKVFDTIKAQVVGSNNLPSNQGVYCVVNTAKAWIEDDTDVDTAQICISKEGQILGATLPKAGPQDNLYLLLGSGILGTAGWALLKKN